MVETPLRRHLRLAQCSEPTRDERESVTPAVTHSWGLAYTPSAVLCEVANDCRTMILSDKDGHYNLKEYRGFTHADFMRRVPQYRDLKNVSDQVEVLTILSQMKGIASDLSPMTISWAFFAAHLAPQGAYHGSE